MRKAEDTGFLFGVLWAAWHLHRGHGEDTYAEEILRMSGDLDTLQRMARENDYVFRRGFWADVKRRHRAQRECA